MKGNEIVIGVGVALGLGLLIFYLYMNKTPVVEDARTTRGLPEHLSKAGSNGDAGTTTVKTQAQKKTKKTSTPKTTKTSTPKTTKTPAPKTTQTSTPKNTAAQPPNVEAASKTSGASHGASATPTEQPKDSVNADSSKTQGTEAVKTAPAEAAAPATP